MVGVSACRNLFLYATSLYHFYVTTQFLEIHDHSGILTSGKKNTNPRNGPDRKGIVFSEHNGIIVF